MNIPFGDAPSDPMDSKRPVTLTLVGGVDLIADWFEVATQPQKNMVNRILFAVVENSVFRDFTVVDDADEPMQFFVLTGSDLAIKFRINGFSSFDVLYIGSSCAAPGLDRPMGGSVEKTEPGQSSPVW